MFGNATSKLSKEFSRREISGHFAYIQFLFASGHIDSLGPDARLRALKIIETNFPDNAPILVVPEKSRLMIAASKGTVHPERSTIFKMEDPDTGFQMLSSRGNAWTDGTTYLRGKYQRNKRSRPDQALKIAVAFVAASLKTLTEKPELQHHEFANFIAHHARLLLGMRTDILAEVLKLSLPPNAEKYFTPFSQAMRFPESSQAHLAA